jgi:hypothetical protein
VVEIPLANAAVSANRIEVVVDEHDLAATVWGVGAAGMSADCDSGGYPRGCSFPSGVRTDRVGRVRSTGEVPRHRLIGRRWVLGVRKRVVGV